MKTLTFRLPDALFAEIEGEARKRRLSKSDIVRERLMSATPPRRAALDDIADLIGAVDRLPPDLSANTKRYLKATGYGLKRPR